MRRFLTTTAYFVLGTAALGLVVLNVMAWSGALVDESPEPAREQAAPAEPAAPPPAPPATPEPVAQPAAPTTVAKRQSTSLTITATRGDCWVEVRAGSSEGEALYQGTLESGETIRFSRDKLWLRLGAASNVDVVVNGRQSEVPPGTVELVLPA